MAWIILTEQGVQPLPDTPAWSRKEALRRLLAAPVLAGGYVWEEFEEPLSRHHARLLLNFQAGWTALAWSVRGPQKLGRFNPPTAPGPAPSAPFGCYLLAVSRLRQTLLPLKSEPQDWPLQLHGRLSRSGPVFLDPRIELELAEPRDLHYQEPGLARRWVRALGYLLGE